MEDVEQLGWRDAEAACRSLARIAEQADGYRHSVDEAGAEIAWRAVVHGSGGEEHETAAALRGRRLGFFRLDGVARSHVKQALARCHIDSAELLRAIVDNPALTEQDVADLAVKLWDGNPGKNGSLWVTGRRVLLDSERVVARALGELSWYWWAPSWELPALAVQLAGGGAAAVEVYTTLAEDAVREGRLTGINRDVSAELVEQALLLVGGG